MSPPACAPPTPPNTLCVTAPGVVNGFGCLCTPTPANTLSGGCPGGAAGGGVFQEDANGNCVRTGVTPVEHAYWGDTPPCGDYVVEVSGCLGVPLGVPAARLPTAVIGYQSGKAAGSWHAGRLCVRTKASQLLINAAPASPCPYVPCRCRCLSSPRAAALCALRVQLLPSCPSGCMPGWRTPWLGPRIRCVQGR